MVALGVIARAAQPVTLRSAGEPLAACDDQQHECKPCEEQRER